MKNESSDGAVGGGAFVAQWTQDMGGCSSSEFDWSLSSQQLFVSACLPP
jgi:hypothetical protein